MLVLSDQVFVAIHVTGSCQRSLLRKVILRVVHTGCSLRLFSNSQDQKFVMKKTVNWWCSWLHVTNHRQRNRHISKLLFLAEQDGQRSRLSMSISTCHKSWQDSISSLATICAEKQAWCTAVQARHSLHNCLCPTSLRGNRSIFQAVRVLWRDWTEYSGMIFCTPCTIMPAGKQLAIVLLWFAEFLSQIQVIWSFFQSWKAAAWARQSLFLAIPFPAKFSVPRLPK